MTDINLLRLLIIVAISFAILLLAARSTCSFRRQTILAWGIGLLFFNGIAGAYNDVPAYYIWYYFIFLITSLLTLYMTSRLLVPLSKNISWRIAPLIEYLDTRKISGLIITIYFFLHLMPLLYPEFRLFSLFNPSGPDLLSAVTFNRVTGDKDPLLKIISYLFILLTPFFYIALYRMRYRFKAITIIFLAIIYIDYVQQSYLSRGEFAVYIGTFLIALWALKPQSRKSIFLILVFGLPIFLAFSYIYEAIRLGRDFGEFLFWDSLLNTIESQTSFASIAAIPLIESDYRANLDGYLIWLITLPLPKLLFGNFEISQIAYEISEIVIGRKYGDYNYFVLLAGVLGESVYIFGNGWFWLHAVFFGLLMALVMSLLEKFPQTIFLQGYLIMIFGYSIPRGGVNSGLPIIVNTMLLFYVLVAAVLLKVRR